MNEKCSHIDSVILCALIVYHIHVSKTCNTCWRHSLKWGCKPVFTINCIKSADCEKFKCISSLKQHYFTCPHLYHRPLESCDVAWTWMCRGWDFGSDSLFEFISNSFFCETGSGNPTLVLFLHSFNRLVHNALKCDVTISARAGAYITLMESETVFERNLQIETRQMLNLIIWPTSCECFWILSPL